MIVVPCYKHMKKYHPTLFVLNRMERATIDDLSAKMTFAPVFACLGLTGQNIMN